MTRSPSVSSPTRPQALRPGDKVRLISPSGPVIPELLDDGISRLESWGLTVDVDPRAFDRRPPYDYLAGNDETRQRALHDSFCDPDIKAIICTRGGYGAMRLLPQLEISLIAKNPKLLLGFSDITALHLYLLNNVGLTSLHGPVIKSFGRYKNDPHESLAHLRQALFAVGDEPAPWTDLRCVRPGKVRGTVLGGNLSLIIPLLGSPYCPDLSDKILVVEEIEEQDYRLDRMLTALRISERAAGLGGLVLGDFSGCDGTYVPADKLAAFIDRLGAEFACPVVANAPVGHGGRNRCFPVGVQATLDADAGTLQFHSHAAQRA